MSTAPSSKPQAEPRATVAEYLALERAALERHEYYDGRIVAMAGESLSHGMISVNLVASLGSQLKGTPCFALTKGTKVRSGLGIVSLESCSGMFSYPDIIVVCGAPEFFDSDTDIISNPTAIIEVLSPSTELYDRGEKFRRYRSWNPTLQEYLLVAQDQPFIERFQHQAENSWNMTEYSGLAAVVQLVSIPCELKLADVYDRVSFAAASQEEPAK